MCTRRSSSRRPVAPGPRSPFALGAGLFSLTIAAACVVSGCNTIKGIGRDITGAAESTEQAFSGWTEPEDPYPPRGSYRPAEPSSRSTEPYTYRR